MGTSMTAELRMTLSEMSSIHLNTFWNSLLDIMYSRPSISTTASSCSDRYSWITEDILPRLLGLKQKSSWVLESQKVFTFPEEAEEVEEGPFHLEFLLRMKVVDAEKAKRYGADGWRIRLTGPAGVPSERWYTGSPVVGAALTADSVSVEEFDSNGRPWRRSDDSEDWPDVEKWPEDDDRSKDNLPEESIQLYPNPFLTSLNVNLRIYDSLAIASEDDGASSVRIYDVRGRLVKTVLEQELLHPGEYLRVWDGYDEHGKEAAPGVYYVKLQIGDRSVTKRVILLR